MDNSLKLNARVHEVLVYMLLADLTDVISPLSDNSFLILGLTRKQEESVQLHTATLQIAMAQCPHAGQFIKKYAVLILSRS